MSATQIAASDQGSRAPAGRWPAGALAVLALLVYPHVAPDFWVVSIGAYAMVLGIIALSLTFLAAYGGMISLAQMATAGVAGYTLAIFSAHAANTGVAMLPWPWALVLAIATGTLAGFLIGLVAVRSQGIYMLMSTLAIAMILFYLAQQNTTLLHGFDGFRGVAVPGIGGVSLREPMAFYYLCLAAATALYALVIYLVRVPFGLVIQGIRDDPRRMASLGYRVGMHQVMAFTLAGFIAAVGGVLALWYHGGISPGSIGITATVAVLIAAVIGGLGHPRGAFIGALVYVLIQTFAVDLVGSNRFNTLIGLVFLAIVMASPDGLLGLWRRARKGGSERIHAGVPTPRR
jgi:branched-chain amino acid transport system permease protein